MADRFWVVLTWILVLAIILGVLRYYQGANQLAKTFFGWFYNTTVLLSGLQPGGPGQGPGGVPNYAGYNSQGA